MTEEELRDAQLIGGDACPMNCGVVLAYSDYEGWGLIHPNPQCGWRPDGLPSSRWGADGGRHPTPEAGTTQPGTVVP